MPRVIVLDPLSKEGLDLLDAAPGIQYEVRTGLKGDDLRQALAEFDGAIVRSGVKITADALEGNQRLKAIVRAGVGTDNIDGVAATRLGIVVMNTPTGNTLSTAEHAIALMLAMARNIAPAYQSLIEGRWDRGKYMGTQLADKTLGIVGLGRIGQAVAARARAFEMRVLGYDPFLSSERAKELGIEIFPSVDGMLPHVDFLTVHTPLTEETRGLIGKRQLEILKPGVRLINGARGGIYDEAALVEGLQSGRIAGVALDVFAEEPCTKSPLYGLPGVVCTPHLGASTEEAQAKVAVEGVTLLVDFLTTGAIRHAVNMTPVDPQKLAGLRGFLDVAYRLGILHAQMGRGAPQACRLIYRGEVASKDTKLITASFAAGLLRNALAQQINIVNAEVLLRERGIKLYEESRSDTGDFSSMITVEVETESKKYIAAGTLFGSKLARLVRLGDYRLEAYLDGILLIFTHHDVPGIIGSVGTIFGKHRVNIAQMSVGRASESPGGEAIGVLNLDSAPPAAALEEVLGHPDIESVSVIQLPQAGEMPAWMLG
ncbi:MAG: phosphoglycerate dehydrogenase [Pirellulales bacterium]|nr:phosphoglycerate dehydrogenase [Pirellulales bacterium]